MQNCPDKIVVTNQLVFLFDDDRTSREILERKLSERSFTPMIYASPERLLQDLRGSRPAAVFMEIEQRELDGVSFVSRIRELGYRGSVVIVTSCRNVERLTDAVRAGADHVLFKPPSDIGFDITIEKVRGYLERELQTIESLKGILGHLEQGVVVLEEGMTPVFINRHALEILGCAGEGEAAAVIERDCPPSLLTRCRDGQASVTYLDITTPAADKSKLVGIEVHPLDSMLGASYYLLLIHDFSKWKKLDELHARFATTLSHRMRTPLTSIRNAVKLLSSAEDPVSCEDRSKLLDIGWRNVEKLIAYLDELQKIFMIDSEEMNVCRTLTRVDNDVHQILSELEGEKKIRGFKSRMHDMALLTGRGRLRDFIATAAEAYGKWLGDRPYLECVSSLTDDLHHFGDAGTMVRISIRPRFHGSRCAVGGTLKDFLSYHEAHHGLVLNRIAAALDGELEISTVDSISLSLPVHPPFNREKDLVHPLHMMIERGELTGGEFHLITLRMVGMVEEGSRFARLLEKSLCKQLFDNGIVSRGEEPLSYSIFVIGSTADEVTGFISSVQERFVKACQRSGQELYPALRWEIRYSRTPGHGDTTIDSTLIEQLV